MQNRDTTF